MPKTSNATSVAADQASVTARSKLRKLISHDIAVDFGTANTLVSIDGVGIVIDEPSVVATNNRTNQIVAIGSDARNMVGRTPKTISAIQPLVDGVVNDFEVAEQLLRSFVRQVHDKHKVLIQRPRIVVGLPCGVTEVERRAVEEAARSAGARKVYLIEEPVAAAIGSGVDIMSKEGSLIVDIGGGTTEIAVVANGSSVITKSVRVAGDEINEALLTFLRDEYNLQVGKRTAEEIKINIGIVGGKADARSMVVRGRNIATGLPQELELSSDMIKHVLARQIRPITEAVKSVLDETPPELISDIMQDGIHVAGGGALIAGFDRLLRSETNIDVHVPNNALTAVVEGAAIALAERSKYRRCLTSCQ